MPISGETSPSPSTLGSSKADGFERCGLFGSSKRATGTACCVGWVCRPTVSCSSAAEGLGARASTAQSHCSSASLTASGTSKTGESAPGTPAAATRSSASTVAPSAGRSEASLASMRATRSSTDFGTSARSVVTRGACSKRTCAISPRVSSAMKGGRAVRHLKSRQPSEKTSARAVTPAAPRTCSGDMYPGVPSSAPSLVSRAACASRAMPKSSSLGMSVPWSTKTFEGLISRWTMPRACAKASAEASWLVTWRLSATPSPPSSAMRALGEALALQPLHRHVQLALGCPPWST